MNIRSVKTNQVASSIKLNSVVRLLLTGFLSIGIVACGGSDEDPEPVSGTLASDVSTLIRTQGYAA
ncbi:MAG: hypothetical protein ACI845_002107, partial [Gammaproteobacteria bacterium]